VHAQVLRARRRASVQFPDRTFFLSMPLETQAARATKAGLFCRAARRRAIATFGWDRACGVYSQGAVRDEPFRHKVLWSEADRDTGLGHICLRFTNGVVAEVEDRGGEHRARVAVAHTFNQMF